MRISHNNAIMNNQLNNQMKIEEEKILYNYIEIESKDFGSVKEAYENAKYPLLEEISIKEDKGNVLNIIPNFTSPVRSYQEKVLNIMCNNGIARRGIIVFLCGVGKTLVGIYTISTIKRIIIIICNNNITVNQWWKEINKRATYSKRGKNENNDKDKVSQEIGYKYVYKFTSNINDYILKGTL